MDQVDEYIKKVTEEALKNGIPKGIALNVNIPVHQKEPIKGIKICRQANANWEEQFDERKDPYGRKYFWMVGNFVNHDKGEDNDEWALANNYVDMTGHNAISRLNEEWDI